MGDSDNMETGIGRIPGTRRQVMDWSLVLASQGIDSVLDRDESQWTLLLPARDIDQARQIISLYRAENRGWRWKTRLPKSHLSFHFGAAFWVLTLILLDLWCRGHPSRMDALVMSNAAVSRGEWWRLFTAVSLHLDLGHLLANATTGLLLLALAMAAFGPGMALLGSYCGGALGNLLGYFIYSRSHLGLGASGMVMAALGLLSTQPVHGTYPAGINFLLRSLASGFFLLIIWGTSPGSDMVAHFGGFISGLLWGLALRPWRRSLLKPNVQTSCLALTVALFLVTWILASR